MKKILLILTVFALFITTKAFSQSDLRLNVKNIDGKAAVINIPAGYHLHYFLSEKEGDMYVVVLCPDNNQEALPVTTRGWKVFVGTQDYIRETRVFTLEILKDGGTVIVQTENGPLYVPTSFLDPKRTDYLSKPHFAMRYELVFLDKQE